MRALLVLLCLVPLSSSETLFDRARVYLQGDDPQWPQQVRHLDAESRLQLYRLLLGLSTAGWNPLTRASLWSPQLPLLAEAARSVLLDGLQAPYAAADCRLLATVLVAEPDPDLRQLALAHGLPAFTQRRDAELALALASSGHPGVVGRLWSICTATECEALRPTLRDTPWPRILALAGSRLQLSAAELRLWQARSQQHLVEAISRRLPPAGDQRQYLALLRPDRLNPGSSMPPVLLVSVDGGLGQSPQAIDWFGRRLDLSRTERLHRYRQLQDLLPLVQRARRHLQASDASGWQLLEAPAGSWQYLRRFAITLPEAHLVGWLHSEGDRPAAAALVATLIGPDTDTWLLLRHADEILAQVTWNRLLAAVARSDWPQALRLAELLRPPNYLPGPLSGEAAGIAVDLLQRQQDGLAFALPAVDRWPDLQRRLPRPVLINFLSQRLRLLRLPDSLQDGVPDFTAPQSTADGQQLLNPYQALQGMDLQPAELRQLLPLLEDRRVLAALRFRPRDSIHYLPVRVSDCVGALLNTRLRSQPWQQHDYWQQTPERRAAWRQGLDARLQAAASATATPAPVAAIPTAEPR